MISLQTASPLHENCLHPRTLPRVDSEFVICTSHGPVVCDECGALFGFEYLRGVHMETMETLLILVRTKMVIMYKRNVAIWLQVSRCR